MKKLLVIILTCLMLGIELQAQSDFEAQEALESSILSDTTIASLDSACHLLSANLESVDKEKLKNIQLILADILIDIINSNKSCFSSAIDDEERPNLCVKIKKTSAVIERLLADIDDRLINKKIGHEKIFH